MIAALASLIAEAPPYLGNSVLHGLAVGVGGAIGYLALFSALWLVGKFALKQRIPTKVHRMISLVGAIAVAIAIWITLFDRTIDNPSQPESVPTATAKQ